MRREEEISEQKLGGAIRVSRSRVWDETRRDEVTKTKTLPATESGFIRDRLRRWKNGHGRDWEGANMIVHTQLTEVCIDVAECRGSKYESIQVEKKSDTFQLVVTNKRQKIKVLCIYQKELELDASQDQRRKSSPTLSYKPIHRYSTLWACLEVSFILRLVILVKGLEFSLYHIWF